MGIFDTFIMRGHCWRCNRIIKEWQSKAPDLHVCLRRFRRGDRIGITELAQASKVAPIKIVVYNCCPMCNAWNEKYAIIENGIVKGLRRIGKED